MGISENSTLNDKREVNEEYKVKCAMCEVCIPFALHAWWTAYNQRFILLRTVALPNYPFAHDSSFFFPQFPFGEFSEMPHFDFMVLFPQPLWHEGLPERRYLFLQSRLLEPE